MTGTKESKSTSSMKVIVRQTRSLIGRNERVRGTLNALGLGKVGQEQEHVLSPSITGMIEKVKSIVRVRKA